MKSIQLLILSFALLLTACATPAPIVTATATSSPIPAPTETSTPLPPMVDVKIMDSIGETEYGELSASIGANGEISGVDYGAGKNFEGKINPETIASSQTTNMLSPVIVTAEAKDESGASFKVVWNAEYDHWVKVTPVFPDSLDPLKHTLINNIDRKMKSPTDDRSDTTIGSGDADLIFLALGYDQLPDEAITPQFWVNVEESQVEAEVGRLVVDFFLSLSNTFQDGHLSRLDGELVTKEKIAQGYFTSETKPYKYVATLDGVTSDGEAMKVLVKLNKNTDGSTFFTYIGLDTRAWEMLFSKWETFPDGIATIEESTQLNNDNIIPVIPFPEELYPWDVGGNDPDLGGDGFLFSIYLEQVGDFAKNTTVGMQDPGVVFDTLPEEVQAELTDNIEALREVPNPRGQGANFVPFYSLLLSDGISPEMAKALRRISVAGFVPDGLDGARIRP